MAGPTLPTLIELQDHGTVLGRVHVLDIEGSGLVPTIDGIIGILTATSGSSTSSFPGAPTGSIQYNNAGTFAGDADLKYDAATKTVRIFHSVTDNDPSIVIDQDYATAFLEINPIVAAGASARSVSIGATIDSGPTMVPNLVGVSCAAYPGHTSEIATSARGLDASVFQYGAGGTISTASAIRANLITTDGAMIDGYNLNIDDSLVSGTGVIQNLYGIRIADMNDGSISNHAIKTGLGLCELGDYLKLNQRTGTPVTGAFFDSQGRLVEAPIIGAVSFPVHFPAVEINLAAGISVNMDGVNIPSGKTGKLYKVTLSSSVSCKWVLKTVDGAVETTVDTLYTSGLQGRPTYTWNTPQPDFVTQAGTGTTQRFRVTATNLDRSNAADAHVTFYWDEV